PGIIGAAVNLDGASQYVDLGTSLDSGTGDTSVFAWVKTTQSGGTNMIISKRDSSGTTNPGYQLFQNANGTLSFMFAGGTPSNRIRVDSTGPHINDGNWHWVGAVFHRGGNGILYVDGQPALNGAADITSQAGNSANNNPLRVGAEQQVGPAFLWQGAIDE